jgi:TetR/AcrR family transcriptional regulator, regulator of cefoperazone and chloramphenicol sensitivity
MPGRIPPVPRPVPSPRRRYASADVTRDALLEAALRVFAERGYRLGTVREICRRAGVNGAMANYHFGSKQDLYRAALREAVVRIQKKASRAGIDGRSPKDALEARARLRARVGGIASGLLAKGSAPESLLLHREFVEPTAALDEVVEELVRPRFDALRAAVRGLSPGATEREVTWAALSIVGQVAYHRIAGPIVLRLLGERAYGTALVSELVEHVAGFSERALGVRRGRAGSVA